MTNFLKCNKCQIEKEFNENNFYKQATKTKIYLFKTCKECYKNTVKKSPNYETICKRYEKEKNTLKCKRYRERKKVKDEANGILKNKVGRPRKEQVKI